MSPRVQKVTDTFVEVTSGEAFEDAAAAYLEGRFGKSSKEESSSDKRQNVTSSAQELCSAGER